MGTPLPPSQVDPQFDVEVFRASTMTGNFRQPCGCETDVPPILTPLCSHRRHSSHVRRLRGKAVRPIHGCKFDLTVGINMRGLMTLGVRDCPGASARWPRSLDAGREQVHHERTRETSRPTTFIQARAIIPANPILLNLSSTERRISQSRANFGYQNAGHLLCVNA